MDRTSLLRYKIGYELSWAVLRRVQGSTEAPREGEKVRVELVPEWTVEVALLPLLMEEVVRMDDGRKVLIMRPDHHRVTAVADQLMMLERQLGHVSRWLDCLSDEALHELEDGLRFYQNELKREQR